MDHDIYDPLNQVSLEDLERLARSISMESEIGGGLQNKSKSHVMQFFRNAGVFFAQMKLPSVGFATTLNRDLDGFVGKVGFVEVSNKSVIVPEGFVGQWVPYSQALKDTMGKATKMEAMVRSFNDTLGRVIHAPSLLSAASGVGHNGPSTLGITSDMMAIGKQFFDGNSGHITRNLCSVIDRHADIRVTTNLLADAVSLDKAHPAKKVVDAVGRTMALANTLMASLQARSAESEGAAVMDVALQELVELTLSIAKEMESYGTLLYRIRQFSESLNDSLKELKK